MILSPKPVVLTFVGEQYQLGGLVKTQLLSSSLGASDPVGLGWGLRICLSDKDPSDADAAGQRTTLAKLLT